MISQMLLALETAVVPTTHTLNAIDLGGGAYGMVTTIGGSLVPGTIDGNTVQSMYDYPGGSTGFNIDISADVPQTMFTSVTINGETRLTSFANFTPYDPGPGITSWNWIGDPIGITGAGTYGVDIVL
jgi:hypothetical protein